MKMRKMKKRKMKKIELILLGMLLLLFLTIILNISIALDLRIVSTNIIKAPAKENIISDSKHFPFSREAHFDLLQQKLHGITS
jgi:cell division protein FtsB